MKDFKTAQPKSLEQVTAFLAQKKERVFLMAGGTDILGEMKQEVISPEVIVDLRSIPNLAYLRKEKDGLHIGAMTTVAELAENPQIRDEYRALFEAAKAVASPQLRNVGTVGGNLCQRPRCWYYRDAQFVCRKKGGSRCFAAKGRNKYHAIFGGGICYIVHPSDLAPALIALSARAIIVSANGERVLALQDFFALPAANVRKENVLAPDEVLKEVVLPPAEKGDRSTYDKFKERGTWDFAVVSVAAKISLSGSAAREIRIVLGGVAPVPWALKKASSILNGKKLTETLLRQAIAEELAEAKPLAENGYKKELVAALVPRAVLSLVSA